MATRLNIDLVIDDSSPALDDQHLLTVVSLALNAAHKQIYGAVPRRGMLKANGGTDKTLKYQFTWKLDRTSLPPP